MDKLKKIRLTNAMRLEARNNILRGLFEPRLAEVEKEAQAWAQSRADLTDPKFVELYADKAIRPYLRHSNTQKVYIHPVEDRRGKPLERLPCYEFKSPDLYIKRSYPPAKDPNNLILRYSDAQNTNEQPAPVYVLAHRDVDLYLTPSESREYWAMRAREQELLKEFNRLKEAIGSALAAATYLADFHQDYPEFSHLTKIDAYKKVEAPMPVPASATLVNMVEQAGLTIPSPLNKEQAQ